MSKTSLSFTIGSTTQLADVQKQIEAGAELNPKIAEGEYGWTPLLSAAYRNSNLDVINALIKAGADVNAKNCYGATALHLAARRNKNPEIINALIQSGLDVNAKNNFGETPLHVAALDNENPEVIKVLIEAGSDVNAKHGKDQEEARRSSNCLDYNYEGCTPLHFAAWPNANPEIIKALVQAGADINATDKEGRTPLHLAATMTEEFDTLFHLIQVGAKVNARDKEGRTPLHYAAKYTSDPEVITALVQVGAKRTVKDKSGKRPIDYVHEYNIDLLEMAPELEIWLASQLVRRAPLRSIREREKSQKAPQKKD